MLSKIIFLLFLYLLYRTAKSWYQNNFPKETGETGKSQAGPADLMVQDPFCKVYFPKREGLRLETEGRDVYFCSEACRDNFLLAQKQRKET
jgi:YHS domain-containing protein